MAKKAKKRMHQMPPLSFVDKMIYWGIFLLLAVSWFFLMEAILNLRDRIAFADENVIACRDHPSYFLAIIPWMTYFLTTLILWLLPYQNRRPILGLKNFRYGPPAWPKVYPLFMKGKPYVWVSERSKKDRKRVAALLVLLLLVSFIPFPLSLFGRDCLLRDGTVIEYNMFNSPVRQYPPGAITGLEIETYRYSIGKYDRTRQGVRMVFRTGNGKKYPFDHRTFREGPNAPFWLDSMMEVKQRYRTGVIRYDGTADLPRVMTDSHIPPEKFGQLQQLFGQ